MMSIGLKLTRGDESVIVRCCLDCFECPNEFSCLHLYPVILSARAGRRI